MSAKAEKRHGYTTDRKRGQATPGRSQRGAEPYIVVVLEARLCEYLIYRSPKARRTALYPARLYVRFCMGFYRSGILRIWDSLLSESSSIAPSLSRMEQSGPVKGSAR